MYGVCGMIREKMNERKALADRTPSPLFGGKPTGSQHIIYIEVYVYIYMYYVYYTYYI